MERGLITKEVNAEVPPPLSPKKIHLSGGYLQASEVFLILFAGHVEPPLAILPTILPATSEGRDLQSPGANEVVA